MHTHGSLAKDGRNAFHDPDAPMELSNTALYYIGGILKHAKAITRIANPTIKACTNGWFPAMSPGLYFMECNQPVGSGERTRTRGNSTRAEFRSPDPMCNPYLTFAAMLTAGLDGIKNKIEPPESTNMNIYHMSEDERKKLGIEMLPGSLIESQNESNNDSVIAKAIGSHVMEGLNSITRLETDAFRLAVHPWELDRYLATY